MKKIIIPTVLCILLLAGFAYAEEDFSSFDCSFGAKVRLLQLESSITKNILWGEKILDAARNKSADTGNLSMILDELEILKQEVSETQPVSGEESAQRFVDLKDEAKVLTEEFRAVSHEIFTSREIASLRGKLENSSWKETKNISAEIKNARREYNLYQINSTLSDLGIENESLMLRVGQGNMTKSELKGIFRASIENMSSEDKKNAFFNLREKTAQNNVFTRSALDKINTNRTERLREHMESRISKMAGKNDSLNNSERIESLRAKIGEKILKMNQGLNKTISRIDNRTTAKIGRLEDRSEKAQNKTEKISGHFEDKLSSGNLSGPQEERITSRIKKTLEKGEQVQQRIEDRESGVLNKSDSMKARLAKKGGVTEDE